MLEVKYVRGACDVSKRDAECNVERYGRFGIRGTMKGVNSKVVDWVK